MSVAQRRKPAVDVQPPRRQEYIAAVRYADGRRDLFHVLNADDLADARELVMLELGEVRSLVIAARR